MSRKFCRAAVLQEDLERIAADVSIDWEQLRDKTVLVTGGTGLLGGMVARGLICASVQRGLNLRVLALVRSLARGEEALGDFLEDGLVLVEGDILSRVCLDEPVDYIIHGASVTASKAFVDTPVETITTALKGTEHLLELAKEKKVKSMVYLSSMEIYGVVDPANEIVREKDYGYIDPLLVRSSYSEGKRMTEGLCAAYAHEYGVPVKMARLAQTFGAGIARTENRVFVQFARSVMEGTDIVLHTDGSKAHCYCYTSDAVRGLLTILLKGNSGEAYNVSNERTYGSIREMAQMLIEKHPGCGSRLVFDIPEDVNQFGYAPTSRMLINSEKLRGLGWEPQVDLPEMFERLMAYMEWMQSGE